MTYYGCMHFAYAARGWMGFIAMQTDGRAILRHELTFYKKTPEVVAREILAFQKAHGIARLVDCIAQPELFPATKKSRGETVSDTFRAHGINLSPGDKDRPNGWARIRAWFEVRTFRDADHEVPRTYEAPSLQVHRDCVYFLDTFLTLVSDPKNPDDIDETTDEFPACALRYWAMARPLPPQEIEKVLPPDCIGHDVDAIRRALRRH